MKDAVVSRREKPPIAARAPRLFARLRQRQLESAIRGRFDVSARYARFARRVRAVANALGTGLV